MSTLGKNTKQNTVGTYKYNGDKNTVGTYKYNRDKNKLVKMKREQ